MTETAELRSHPTHERFEWQLPWDTLRMYVDMETDPVFVRVSDTVTGEVRDFSTFGRVDRALELTPGTANLANANGRRLKGGRYTIELAYVPLQPYFNWRRSKNDPNIGTERARKKEIEGIATKEVHLTPEVMNIIEEWLVTTRTEIPSGLFMNFVLIDWLQSRGFDAAAGRFELMTYLHLIHGTRTGSAAERKYARNILRDKKGNIDKMFRLYNRWHRTGVERQIKMKTRYDIHSKAKERYKENVQRLLEGRRIRLAEQAAKIKQADKIEGNDV